MKQKVKDREAYLKVTDAFKKMKNGATVADVVAKTSLPLATVKQTAAAVADEYSARLQVTESGEILYSFPRGFKSKYRGFRVFWRNFWDKAGGAIKAAASFLFKIWIMVMLVGYFALFMLIALASLILSMAGNSNSNSNSNRGGGGLYLASSIFNMIIRIWFYSELTKAMDPRYAGRQARPKGRPLHKAIFSFVFGDGDPNADFETKTKQAVIAYIQANKGVISLPEFIILTGLKPAEAQSEVASYCAEFGGSPEATDDGTVVYRFDDLLLRSDTRDRSFGGSSPIKSLEAFSSNKKSMNRWFCVINGVNVLFGGYYFFNALTTGVVIWQERTARAAGQFLSQATGEAASALYGYTYAIFSGFAENPLPGITIGLGVVPLVFSVFFWLIPALRAGSVKKRNEAVKLENLRKIGYNRLWASPRSLQSTDIAGGGEEAKPENMAQAQDRLIKEMYGYSMPEVGVDAAGKPVYDFAEIEREKRALGTYRNGVRAAGIGGTVFDSDARA